jgi:hypothetical protein
MVVSVVLLLLAVVDVVADYHVIYREEHKRCLALIFRANMTWHDVYCGNYCTNRCHSDLHIGPTVDIRLTRMVLYTVVPKLCDRRSQ